MSVIYEPKGKAKEYSDLALNLFTGCSHGCKYCYAPNVLHRDRDTFHGKVESRKDIIAKLTKEAPAHKGKEVLLCFTCDPYCPEAHETGITREAIKILHSNSVRVNILTKGGLRLERDLDILSASPELSKVGTTLTMLTEERSLEWEPNAAIPADRIDMLYKAHIAGIETWASLEPVIIPHDTLWLIKSTHKFVDHYKVGRWNYDPRAKDINWAKFLVDVTELLDSLGASYYIKKDLAAFGDVK